MEKLQPLITHRFWVLFGLALLVPLVSWFLYNGSMQEQIQGREDTLKSEVSKAGQGAKAPNQSWIAGAKKLNELHRAAYDRSAQKLWLDQQNHRPSIRLFAKESLVLQPSRPRRIVSLLRGNNRPTVCWQRSSVQSNCRAEVRLPRPITSQTEETAQRRLPGNLVPERFSRHRLAIVLPAESCRLHTKKRSASRLLKISSLFHNPRLERG